MEVLANFAVGVFCWTFVEYLIHGWLGHSFQTFVTPLHAVHHRDPHAVFAIGAWLPLGILWSLGLLEFGFSPPMIFFTGLLTGFIAYEVLHYRIHFARSRNRWETGLRMRHLFHHQANPHRCYGVSTQFWDRVFGTTPETATNDSLKLLAEIRPLSGRSNASLIWRLRR